VTATTLPELLLASAREDPSRPFLVFEGRTRSRGEFAGEVLRAAGWFQRAGLGERSRVAIMLENEPEFLVAWFAANLAGAAIVPLDPALRGEELAERLTEVRPAAVVVQPPALSAILALRERFPQMRLIIAGAAPRGTTPWSELIEGAPATPAPPRADRPMEIIYTAGTTARPHGVTWRQDFLPPCGLGLAKLLGLSAGDRLMIVLPLFAANAQLSVAMALARGAAIALERRFVASRFWSRAKKAGATQVSLSGVLLSELQALPHRKAERGHGIRIVLSVATPPDLHQACENRFGVSVVEVYGTTEAGFVAVNPVERGRRKLGTAGLPVPWREVAVLDERMRRVRAGVTGEICVRSGKAWLRSGDLGTCDEEGFLTFIDRREDVLRAGGEIFSTRPIERALRLHPAVVDAAVVALPGGPRDEPLAVVVLRAPVSFDELARFCREWLDGHPVPICFKAVEQIPKTPSGRIRKGELRAYPGLFDHLYRVA
jgi:crotonobetaine/carnitine-CoA ligase